MITKMLSGVFGAAFSLALFSCNSDEPTRLLARKWAMANDNITVEFKKNGRYIWDNEKGEQKGSWELIEDNQLSIVVSNDRDTAVLPVKQLDEENLILEHRSGDMIFQPAD
ncbi:MAG: hypothetical protein M3Q97_11495 [Bacteroidota bacterium]|nr:hypothetical protein [Bacteroidota bacterium]